jgi:hypothetical protein
MVRLDIKHQEEFVSEVVVLPSLASTSAIVNPARNTIFFSPTLWLILVTAIGFIIFGEI